jgi:hypothetical protein
VPFLGFPGIDYSAIPREYKIKQFRLRKQLKMATADPPHLVNAIHPDLIDRMDPQFIEIYTKHQGKKIISLPIRHSSNRMTNWKHFIDFLLQLQNCEQIRSQ